MRKFKIDMIQKFERRTPMLVRANSLAEAMAKVGSFELGFVQFDGSPNIKAIGDPQFQPTEEEDQWQDLSSG